MREAAERLAVSEDTIRRAVSAGELKALRIGLGPKPRVRIPLEALADFVVASTVGSEAA